MLNLLFTYGTLLSGFKNEAAVKLHQTATLIGKAKCNAKMYLIKNKYPGAVLSKFDSDWIEGEIWNLADPYATFVHLDKYEECSKTDPKPHEYQRIQTQVFTIDKSYLVWIYEYIGIYDSLNKIESGIFASR
jgi:gamma-glutamylcyclotransferase (GGCT)/AIG2-like uncharacterized protein YtfP